MQITTTRKLSIPKQLAVVIDKPVQTVTLEDAPKVLSDEIAARPDASDRGEKLLKSLKNLL